MKIILLLLFVSISSYGAAQNPLIKYSNPAGLAQPKGYTTAVVVDLGRAKMVIVSGLVSTDVQGNLVGKDDFVKQTDQIFAKLKIIAENEGGGLKDIVKLGNFLKDMKNLQIFRDIRDRTLHTSTPPASTTVEVTKLVTDDFLLEVEATMIIMK